jgi:sugar phosphate isomerase/epimerase
VNAIDRLSLNQATVKRSTVAEAADGCVRHGIPAIGLWREPVAEYGIAKAAALVRAAGLRVSSLCRGGFFTTAPDWLADNRQAVDEAAELAAATLVLVVGGLPGASRDLAAARDRVAEAVAELAPYAAAAGVVLSLEPLHPMYCADRAVLSTLAQAVDLAEAHDVGVVVDTFHVWWDPDALGQIARAGRRIASFQLADFLTPLPADVLLGRGHLGDGWVDFPPLVAAVEDAGYSGDIEVEIFNAEVWAAEPDAVIGEIVRRYNALMAAYG